MSALVIVVLKLEVVKKKSRRQCMSGFLLLKVNLLASGLKQRQMSMRSNTFEMCLTSFNELLWVTGLPPFLSFWTSSTKLKSPPRIISLQSKQRSWFRTFWKNVGLSSFGAQILTKVKILLSNLISTDDEPSLWIGKHAL